MSDEMIQRVARALCALDCKAASGILGSEDLCIFGECSRWGDNTGHARAAIEAMREPTEYMLSHALGDGAWCTANSWRAMIDAALPSRVAALQTERDEAVKAERERCAVLRVWLLDLSANESDPNEPVADNGATVWDHIRGDARRFAESLT